MPYDLRFTGDFFQVADLLAGLDSLVGADKKGTDVDGRLITINGFTMAPPEPGLTTLDVDLSISAYVLPDSQGLTAGATPLAPLGRGSRGQRRAHLDRTDAMKLPEPPQAQAEGDGEVAGERREVALERPHAAVAEDLYRDMRDRRLLLPALLLVDRDHRRADRAEGAEGGASRGRARS